MTFNLKVTFILKSAWNTHGPGEPLVKAGPDREIHEEHGLQAFGTSRLGRSELLEFWGSARQGTLIDFSCNKGPGEIH